VSAWLIWASVGLALVVLVVRRRSVAIATVTLQTLAIGAGAMELAGDRSTEYTLAALVLVGKGLLVGVVLALAVRRTRETRAVRAAISPLTRAAAASALALAFVWLAPPFGLHPRIAGQAALAIVAIGISITVLQPATLFQVIGLLVAENGLALAAAHVAGGLPVVIELGAAFDLVLVIAVATVFHGRIFEEFGSGDTMLLRDLRD
jgi:hydrogenase-4 component E